jgi:hypothetical protein
MRRALYRVRQFLSSLWLHITPAEQSELGRWLPPLGEWAMRKTLWEKLAH